MSERAATVIFAFLEEDFGLPEFALSNAFMGFPAKPKKSAIAPCERAFRADEPARALPAWVRKNYRGTSLAFGATPIAHAATISEGTAYRSVGTGLSTVNELDAPAPGYMPTAQSFSMGSFFEKPSAPPQPPKNASRIHPLFSV